MLNQGPSTRSCSDAQIIFLNDIQKTIVSSILNQMHDYEMNSKNVLILTSTNCKESKQHTIEDTSDLDKLLQYQNELMNDTLKIAILMYKNQFLNNVITSKQFKEGIVPILLLKRSSNDAQTKNVETSVETTGKLFPNKYMNLLINNEIIFIFINILRNLNKPDEFNNGGISDYSRNLLIKKYIEQIVKRATEIEKHVPDHNYNSKMKHNCPTDDIKYEVFNLSMKIHRAKVHLQRHLFSRINELLILKGVLDRIHKDKESTIQELCTNDRRLNVFIKRTSPDHVINQLKNARQHVSKDIKRINKKMTRVKRIEASLSNYVDDILSGQPFNSVKINKSYGYFSETDPFMSTTSYVSEYSKTFMSRNSYVENCTTEEIKEESSRPVYTKTNLVNTELTNQGVKYIIRYRKALRPKRKPQSEMALSNSFWEYSGIISDGNIFKAIHRKYSYELFTTKRMIRDYPDSSSIGDNWTNCETVSNNSKTCMKNLIKVTKSTKSVQTNNEDYPIMDKPLQKSKYVQCFIESESNVEFSNTAKRQFDRIIRGKSRIPIPIKRYKHSAKLGLTLCKSV